MLLLTPVAGRVGKTSLVLRYVQGIFSPTQPATVQAAFLIKQLQLSNGTEAALSIWVSKLHRF